MKTKSQLFNKVSKILLDQGFKIANVDENRPWGGFFVIDESQAQKFSNQYFQGIDTNNLKIAGKLSPKILLVAPETRLSWQYHYRRAEIWTVVQGPIAVMKSEDDSETIPKNYKNGEVIKLKQGERHRLIGLDDWGIVAEIWQHTNLDEPSDENDIIRVQDDFGR